MAWTPLPIGIDNFEKLIQGKYYYVDKTFFIKELIDMKVIQFYIEKKIY